MRIDEISQRVVWHASYTPDITKFRFLTHLGTWNAAAERALSKDFYADMLNHTNMPDVFMYQVDMSQCHKGIQVLDDPDFGDPMDHLFYNRRKMPKDVEHLLEVQHDEYVLRSELPKMFAQHKISYLWYFNRVESPRSKSYIVLDPECFEITGVQKITAVNLLQADPKLVDLLIKRGIWPPHWREKIKKHLASQRAEQKADTSVFQG